MCPSSTPPLSLRDENTHPSFRDENTHPSFRDENTNLSSGDENAHLSFGDENTHSSVPKSFCPEFDSLAYLKIYHDDDDDDNDSHDDDDDDDGDDGDDDDDDRSECSNIMQKKKNHNHCHSSNVISTDRDMNIMCTDSRELKNSNDITAQLIHKEYENNMTYDKNRKIEIDNDRKQQYTCSQSRFNDKNTCTCKNIDCGNNHDNCNDNCCKKNKTDCCYKWDKYSTYKVKKSKKANKTEKRTWDYDSRIKNQSFKLSLSLPSSLFPSSSAPVHASPVKVTNRPFLLNEKWNNRTSVRMILLGEKILRYHRIDHNASY